MRFFLRKARVAITPRNWLHKSRLANCAVGFGQNQPGYGGRGGHIFRDALEPEFQHLENFLLPGGVFLDVDGNAGIYSIKAARFLAARLPPQFKIKSGAKQTMVRTTHNRGTRNPHSGRVLRQGA